MGKGGDAAATGKATDNELLLHGRLYDVTNLKHPGGSVLKFYSGKGIDSTAAFDNFHFRSKKVKKYLDAIPSRAAPAKTKGAKLSPLMEDFEKLTQELIAEGYFKPSTAHAVYRVAEVILLHLAGGWLILNGYLPIGIALLALGQGRCGWLMHEGGHVSLTGNVKFDHALQVVVYGVGCGMSASWWRNQHNKHHAMPQKLGHDVDLNTLPLVAFNSKVVKKINSVLKGWISLQAILFPIATTSLVAMGWQFFLHPRHMLRIKAPMEMLMLAIRYGLWTALFTTHFGLGGSVLLYLAYNWVASNYIFINFAVSHTHLDVVAKDDTEVDWATYGAVYTMNVAPGPFGFVNWWMSYLNFQIEHHLWPSMPQFHQPQVSHRTRALLEKHGIKYDQRSYTEAMAITFKNLHNVGSDVFLG